MYIDHERKIVFVHNPKTGGRSLIEALALKDHSNPRFFHVTAEEIIYCISRQLWAVYTTIAFVRNPWDRMVSLYEYQKSVDYALFAKLNRSHEIACKYGFEDWLEINAGGGVASTHFGKPQTKWTDGVAHVLRFEQYDSEVRRMTAHLGVKYRQVWINRIERSHYRRYYARSKSVDIVRNIDAETINTYSYQFE